MEKLGSDQALVSVRIKFSNKGEYSHDFRLNPTKNADPEKQHLNRVLISSFDNPTKQKKSFFQVLFKRLRQSVKSIFEAKTGKKWRLNSKQYINGIISFSDFANEHKTHDLDSLDRLAVEFLNKMKDKYNLRDDAIVYLIRHSDETSPHYHFTLLNQNKEGKTLNRRFSPMETAKLQDLAGDSFEKMGINRGIKKAVRVAAGDYNVVNQKMDYLRSNLEPEIEHKQKQLNSLNLTISKRLEQNATITNNAKKYNKLSKNFRTYLNRIIKAENEEQRQLNLKRAAQSIYKIDRQFGEIQQNDLEVENSTMEIDAAIEDIFKMVDDLKTESPNKPKLEPTIRRKKRPN